MFPNGWRCQKLEEVAEIQTGLAIGGKQVSDPIELPYLRVANVQDGFLDLKEIKTVAVERSRVNRYMLQKGDVLLTEGGDFDKLGRGTIWNGQIPNCLHQNHVFAVRTNRESLLPQFFSLLTSSAYGKKYFLSCAKQTTNLASINSAQLKSFPVLIPSLSEQREIIKVLSTWDEAIGLTEQLIAAKQKRKQALMQQLLTGKVRFPEFVQSFQHREVPGLGNMPCDWAISKQGQVAKFFNGRAYKKTEWETSGTPVIRLQNLTGRGDEYYYSRLELPEHQYCNKGDLLYMWSATFGPHIWQGDKAIYHYHIWKVECSENLHKEFLYFLLAHLTEKWMSNTNGMGLLHITKETMESLPIPIPSLAEQHKIANVLNASDQEISLLQQKLAALRQQKKGLMQQLLTGKIRVKV